MIMDNLQAHKGKKVRGLIEERGATVLLLAPYSPDFDPIEEAFSKIKGFLRKAKARSKEGLLEAMGWAPKTVTARDAKGWFGHCGYSVAIS